MRGISLGLIAPALATPVAAQQPDFKAVGAAAFEFGRTRYFQELTRANHCEQVDTALFAQINARFEAARQALAARFGQDPFPQNDPHPPAIKPRGCDRVMIDAYSRHVTQLEQVSKAP